MGVRFSISTWIALVWATVIVLALRFNVPFGVPNEWVWLKRVDTSFDPTWVLTSVAVLVAICGLAYFSAEGSVRSEGRNFAVLVGLIALAVSFRSLLSVLLPQSSRPVPAFWTLVIASPVATSFYDEAKILEQQGLSEYLRHYHKQIQNKPFHAATHPPGLPMLFWLCRRIGMNPTMQGLVPLDEISIKSVREIYIRIAPPLRPDSLYLSDSDLRAAWWVAVFCLLCGITAMLMWAWLAWQLNPNPAIAALIATTPSMLWWQTTVDNIHLLAVTATCALAFCWLRTKSMVWAALTGWIAGLTLWLAFKNAIPLLCIAIWLLWGFLKGSGRLPFLQIFVSVALALSPYLLAWLLFGFQPLETLKAASASHHAQAGAHARSYLPWVFANIADFAMGFGGAWLGLIAVWLWNWRKEGYQPSLTVATFFVLLALDLSGIVRGEVARLWVPFIPLLTFEACKFVPKAGIEVALMSFLQGGIAIALHIQLEFLRPF